jgi:branched-chain amino acid transport system substrate-binding protein
MKKNWIVISLVLVVALGIVLVVTQTKKEPGEIKIGAILILTGPDAKAGQSAKKGVDLALYEINTEATGKNKLKIIFEDDQGEPLKATSALLKLINVDKVSAVIGPMWSTSVLAVAPIAEKNKVVILSPTASAPKITNAGDYIFRNTYSDLFEGRKDAEYAYNELKYKSVGIIYVNIDAGIGIANVFSERFKELGGEIVLKEGYEQSTVDFKSLLAKFRSKQIDLIYLMGYSEMGQIVKQTREMGINLPILSTIMFEISDVIKIAGDAAEGTIYSYPSYDPERGGEIIKKFAEEFKNKYGIWPDPEAAFSYDATKILYSVILQTGSNSENIKDKLYTIKNYIGVTGKTSFDENGDVIKSIGFKIVENGKYVWQTFQY